jgi:hypothetical protein
VRVLGQVVVQFARGQHVVAEWLLDDDPLPALRGGAVLVQQPGHVQMLGHFRKLAGRSGEVKQLVLPQPLVLEAVDHGLQLLVGVHVAKLALAVVQVRGEFSPHGRIHFLAAGKFLQPLLHLRAKRLVRFGPAGETDDAEGRGQLLAREEVIQRGNKFAHREVATRTKDDDGARLRLAAAEIQPAGEKFIELVRRCLILHRRDDGEGVSGLQQLLR